MASSDPVARHEVADCFIRLNGVAPLNVNEIIKTASIDRIAAGGRHGIATGANENSGDRRHQSGYKKKPTNYHEAPHDD